MFDDLLDANRQYQQQFHSPGMTGVAARELAVLTCMDSRIEPLAMLGLGIGDAKIIRTAGARVTDDALRNLVLATNLLGARRVMIIPHTNCAMASSTEEEIAAKVAEASGTSTEGWDFLADPDQQAALDHDLAKVRGCPLIPSDTEIGGFIYDVHSGEVRQVR